MKVVFIKDVKGTARKGDVKDVSEGYARNFLIQQGLAEAATSQRLAEIEAADKKRREEKAHEAEHLQALANKIKNAKVVFTRKGDKSGSTFGSVSQADIAKSLKEKTGKEVLPSAIELKHHLKKAGEHKIDINFGHGIATTIIVSIELA